MKTANIADFKKYLSAFLNAVERGETIEIRRRNIPVAHLTGIPTQRQNHTVLGCGKGSVVFKGNVTDALISS